MYRMYCVTVTNTIYMNFRRKMKSLKKYDIVILHNFKKSQYRNLSDP